jgi:hypothetical protein
MNYTVHLTDGRTATVAASRIMVEAGDLWADNRYEQWPVRTLVLEAFTDE